MGWGVPGVSRRAQAANTASLSKTVELNEVGFKFVRKCINAVETKGEELTQPGCASHGLDHTVVPAVQGLPLAQDCSFQLRNGCSSVKCMFFGSRNPTGFGMLYQGLPSTFRLFSLLVFSVLALSTPSVGQENSSGSRGGYRLLQPQSVMQQKEVEGWQLILWAVTYPACTSEHEQCWTGVWIHLQMWGWGCWGCGSQGPLEWGAVGAQRPCWQS